jgi:hypothetical protein
MACCKLHDRLDKKLHTHAYGGKLCGSLATKIEEVPENRGVFNHAPDEEGNLIQKPEFCCFECPTLKAKGAAA